MAGPGVRVLAGPGSQLDLALARLRRVLGEPPTQAAARQAQQTDDDAPAHRCPPWTASPLLGSGASPGSAPLSRKRNTSLSSACGLAGRLRNLRPPHTPSGLRLNLLYGTRTPRTI